MSVNYDVEKVAVCIRSIDSFITIALHYANLLKLKLISNFPSPGRVDTLIYHEDKKTLWKANNPLPNEFYEIYILDQFFFNPLKNTFIELGKLVILRLLFAFGSITLVGMEEKVFLGELIRPNPLDDSKNTFNIRSKTRACWQLTLFGAL